MPRKPRFNLPGILQHIIQRGSNREPFFLAQEDYQRYLDDLAIPIRNTDAGECESQGRPRVEEKGLAMLCLAKPVSVTIVLRPGFPSFS